MASCISCGKQYHDQRRAAGFTTCLSCGDRAAKQARLGWCVAQEYSKGNYQLITNPETLKQTNPKRTV